MSGQQSLIASLLDESFRPQETRNYGLALVIRDTSICCCTLDFKRNKFLGFHRFVHDELNPQEIRPTETMTFADLWNTLCMELPWLANPFRLVKIAYDGKKTTLVPGLLFDKNHLESYLKFNFMDDGNNMVCHDHLMPLDAWQVYTIPDPLLQSARGIFPKIRIVHYSSLLIESIWLNYKNRINAPQLFLHVREPFFDLMIFDGRQMSYFNTFTFQHPEDVTYYLIFVLEQLNFNPESIPLVLLGDVEIGDGLSELLHRYVRHIETARRNEAYRYSYMLNQLPHQSFFPLFNFFSCGL